MFIPYLLLGSTLVCFLGIWFITVKTDQILSKSPLRGHEYTKLYSLVKKEFNKGNYKTWTHNDIIEKCLNVNTEWNEDPINTKADVSIWVLISACLYISNSHCKKAPIKKKLFKYKHKYFLEYLLLKAMVK